MPSKNARSQESSGAGISLGQETSRISSQTLPWLQYPMPKRYSRDAQCTGADVNPPSPLVKRVHRAPAAPTWCTLITLSEQDQTLLGPGSVQEELTLGRGW